MSVNYDEYELVITDANNCKGCAFEEHVTGCVNAPDCFTGDEREAVFKKKADQD